MAATIAQIIGKINPKLYAENAKDLLKKYKSPDKIPAEEVKPKPISKHTLGYESYTETLEPVYYFILDLMEDFKLKPQKLIDNFAPAPGSTQFAELGTRATAMQQEASRIMGSINTVLRSVLNLVYDLKEFKMRLQYYNDIHSKDKEKASAANLALKQIWMDKVDMQKGNSSLKVMGTQGGFITLINAFLASKTIEDAKKLDLTENIKRIVIPRIHEFNTWIGNSEQELRKRYQIERSYLKSQVNSLKLYSRWAKPYLLASGELERAQSTNAGLVKAFNRTILELTLLGKHSIDVKTEAIEGDFPEQYATDKFIRKMKRGYNSCVLVDFTFRAVPKQGTYIGKADVIFSAYSLNDNELAKLNKELDNSDLGDVLKLIEGATDESINQLRDDVNAFLEEEVIEVESAKKEKPQDESNPFLALIGHYDKEQTTSSPKDKEKPIQKDNWYEENYLRPLAGKNATETIFSLFDIYKKAHGMVSFT